MVPFKDEWGNFMEITDVQIHLALGEDRFKGYVTVTFDNCFVVHSIKLLEEDGKFSLAMPSRKTKSGESTNVAHPINSEFRAVMVDEIVRKYKALTSQS